MAKKKTKNTDIDVDMDFDDLEGMDTDFNIEDDGFGDDERSPSRSTVAKDLAKEAGSGFLDNMIKKTAEKSLPPEYSANYSEVMDLANFTSEVVDRNKQKIDKSLTKLGKEVKKLLPFQIGMLDKYLERKEEEFSEFRQQSEEEMRNTAISSEISTLFDKQLEVQKAMEAKRSSEEQVQTKERLVTTQLNLDLLRSIDSNAAINAAFSTQISKEFFRRSLELQYKMYYLQFDHLRVTRDAFKGFATQFTNIEKNTGLPDFVKLRTTERLSEMLRDNTTQAVYNQLFSRNKYLETVKKRVSRAVDDKVGEITENLGDVTDALSMLNEGGPGSGLRALAGIGASLGGGAMGDFVADKISPKLQDRIKDNKYLKTGANYLGAFGSSPATLLKSLRDKAASKQQQAEDEGHWSAKLFSMAKSGLDLTGEERIDTSLKKGSYLDHNQPAIFDNKFHRSVTESIPLYLAHILKQNTDLSSMYYQVHAQTVRAPNTGLLVYDYESRKLSSAGDIQTKIQNSVFGQKSSKARTDVISANVLSKSRGNISSNKELGKDDRKKLNAVLNAKGSKKALSEYMQKASDIEGLHMDYDTLIYNKDGNAELQKLIDDNPELQKVLAVLRDNSDKDNSYLDKNLSDLQSPYPIEALKQLFVDASKLTRAKQPNIVTNRSATSIAKALSRFILNRGEDISPGNIISLQAFGFFKTEEYTDEVRGNITVLIDDVRRIQNDGDMVMQSSLIALLAYLNESLKSNIEVDPSVFKNLQHLYPDFIKQKNLSIENLAEGKLTNSDDEQYLGYSDIRDSTKAGSREMQSIRETVMATSGLETILARVRKKGDAFKQELMDTKGSPTALAELMLKNATKFRSTVSGALDKTSQELQNRLDQVGKQIDAAIKDGSAKAVTILVQEFDAIDAKLDQYIKLTQEDVRQKTEELQEAKSNITDVTTETKLQRMAQKELEMFIRMGDKNIQSLSKLKAAVGSSRVRLNSLAARGGVSPSEALTEMRSSITSVLENARKQLQELEAIGALERAAATA